MNQRPDGRDAGTGTELQPHAFGPWPALALRKPFGRPLYGAGHIDHADIHRMGIFHHWRTFLLQCRSNCCSTKAAMGRGLGTRQWAERGYTALNLLHKYINQGRANADRNHISPRRLARMLLTRPDNLKAEQHELLASSPPPAPR